MKTVVHREARTLAIESRDSEDTEALCADPRRDQAISDRIPAGRRRRASRPRDPANGIVLPGDGVRRKR
ncbi:hypothetical protein PH203_29345 [Streptomyces sp. S.PB5]|nr:hypothetical protein [Streptomyces sp. S.PB5]